MTLTLTAEETAVIKAQAQDYGVTTPADVLHLLLDEAWWDKQFAESQDVLERLADEARAEIDAGLVEDCDWNTDEV